MMTTAIFDCEMLAIAIATDRILITRDRHLFNMNNELMSFRMLSNRGHLRNQEMTDKLQQRFLAFPISKGQKINFYSFIEEQYANVHMDSSKQKLVGQCQNTDHDLEQL